MPGFPDRLQIGLGLRQPLLRLMQHLGGRLFRFPQFNQLFRQIGTGQLLLFKAQPLQPTFTLQQLPIQMLDPGALDLNLPLNFAMTLIKILPVTLTVA